MIAHVSPADFHFEESYNTLNYAKRAKNIKTSMVKNVQKVIPFCFCHNDDVI